MKKIFLIVAIAFISLSFAPIAKADTLINSSDTANPNDPPYRCVNTFQGTDASGNTYYYQDFGVWVNQGTVTAMCIGMVIGAPEEGEDTALYGLSSLIQSIYDFIIATATGQNSTAER